MKKVLVAFIVVLALAGSAAAGFWWWRGQALNAFVARPHAIGEARVVDIPTGTGPKALANLLQRNQVVSDAELFYRYIRRENAGPRLKAGEYEFQGQLPPPEVLARIVSGQVKVYRFTVPEGLRVEEILPILAQSDLKLDLEKLARLAADPAFLKRAKVPAARIEGYLYPDTYTFTRGSTEEAVLAKMVSRTLEELENANQRRKPGVSLTPHEAITLASIVEKETGVSQERPRISCVFHNRLRQGIKLQTDPTVIYAMKELRGAYSKNITRKDLVTDHPYNTYMRKGLPPGPIASAGAAAIQAALNPLDCDDLFFVSRNDGSHIFCPTLSCHNAAVQKWQVEFFRKARKQGKSQGRGVR